MRCGCVRIRTSFSSTTTCSRGAPGVAAARTKVRAALHWRVRLEAIHSPRSGYLSGVQRNGLALELDRGYKIRTIGTSRPMAMI